MSSKKRRTRPHSPDVEFTASLQAEELRFHEPPETEVRFSGEPGHESESGSDRTHLPESVEPGVTYRDVRIDTGSGIALMSRRTSPAIEVARPQPNE